MVAKENNLWLNLFIDKNSKVRTYMIFNLNTLIFQEYMSKNK